MARLLRELDLLQDFAVLTMVLLAATGIVAGPSVVAVAERCTGATRPRPRVPRAVVLAAVSVACAVLFGLGWARFGASPVMAAWCWACMASCALTITDLRARRLPFPIVGAFVIGGVVWLAMAAAVEHRWASMGFACVAAIGVFVVAAVVQAVAPEHVGGGDTALYGALALYLGWFGVEGLLRGLLLASGLTAVVALVVAACSRRMNSQLPAGPPLLVGALVSMLLA